MTPPSTLQADERDKGMDMFVRLDLVRDVFSKCCIIVKHFENICGLLV